MNHKTVAAFLFTGTLIAISPVSAQETAMKQAPTKATTKTTTKVPKLEDIDVACIQAALDARDTALATMVGSWSSTVREALEERRDTLKKSWDISDYKARRNVQRKAWSDYGKILKKANSIKASERRDAWKTFTHKRKLCEGAYAPEMKTGSTYDANL